MHEGIKNLLNTEQTTEYLANVLDRMEPTWYQKVDLDNFNLFDGNRCIMHYTFGNYERGEVEVRDYIHYEMSDDISEDFGNAFAQREPYESWWIAEIHKRREV